MTNSLYGNAAMAAGYARWRAAVHPHVVERIRERLSITRKVRRALDIGCGSGLSTAALAAIAGRCFGVEPAEPMLRWSHIAAPRVSMAVSRAEELPIAANTMDLITAAGSLNYIDLDRFFPEAKRVLVEGGYLVVYDFGPGRSFTDSRALDQWYDEFEQRYPFPPCREIRPEELPGRLGFENLGHEQYQVSLTLTPEFFVEYAMTETSVAEALRKGTPEQEIRRWCEATLPAVFGGAARDVLFTGYVSYQRAQ